MFEDLFEAREQAKRIVLYDTTLDVWKKLIEEIEDLSLGRYLSKEEIIKVLSQKYNLTKI